MNCWSPINLSIHGSDAPISLDGQSPIGMAHAASIAIAGGAPAIRYKSPGSEEEHTMSKSKEKEDMMKAIAAKIVGPRDGRVGFLGSIGVRLMIGGEEARGGFTLVEHPMSPRALAAPLHRHTHEDEYSYVLEGRVGALLGEEVLIASPGDLVFKPRRQ